MSPLLDPAALLAAAAAGGGTDRCGRMALSRRRFAVGCTAEVRKLRAQSDGSIHVVASGVQRIALDDSAFGRSGQLEPYMVSAQAISMY